jgi:phosphoribosylformimino-5-aminoimidazole carboxamide ribotide isomerase
MSRQLTVVPAIDLRGGRCVRLERGDPARETQYDDDPVERARSFVAAGAQMLHVVDLDGAFGTGENAAALAAICRAVDVPVQTGGGVRSAADVAARINAGAAAVVVGSLLVEDPAAARTLVLQYRDRIVAGIDARGDRVAIRGWQHEGDVFRDDLVRAVANWGVLRVVYTEISRDGMGSGYDVDALAHVASLSTMRVTASGGARTLDDIERLAESTPANVDRAIVGKAIYEGTIDVAAAVTRGTWGGKRATSS